MSNKEEMWARRYSFASLPLSKDRHHPPPSNNVHSPGSSKGTTVPFSWSPLRTSNCSVQSSHSVISNSLRPHEPQHARPPCPSPTPGVHPNPWSMESVMPSNHLILCHPLLLLHSIPPSIRVFSNESAFCIRWPKY